MSGTAQEQHRDRCHECLKSVTIAWHDIRPPTVADPIVDGMAESIRSAWRSLSPEIVRGARYLWDRTSRLETTLLVDSRRPPCESIELPRNMGKAWRRFSYYATDGVIFLVDRNSTRYTPWLRNRLLELLQEVPSPEPPDPLEDAEEDET